MNIIVPMSVFYGRTETNSELKYYVQILSLSIFTIQDIYTECYSYTKQLGVIPWFIQGIKIPVSSHIV